jgi:hypothetical protein
MWNFLSGLDYSALAVQVATNSVVLAIGGWIAKTWADQRFEAAKGEQARQLESAKGEIARLGSQLNAGIEKRKLVFETHFNLEFSNCQEIWNLCDEAYTIAAQTLQYIQREPTEAEHWQSEKEQVIARYDRCRDIYMSVRRIRPFIAKSIADEANELARSCLRIANDYMGVYIEDMKGREKGEYFDRKPFITEMNSDLGKVSKMYDGVAEQISLRIDKLYVADFSSGTS